MSAMGLGRVRRPDGHVRGDAESGSQFRTLAASYGRCGLMIRLWVSFKRSNRT
jgi:hypothetical protein